MQEVPQNVQRVISAVKALNMQERRQLLDAMVEFDEIWEEMRDLALISLRQNEPSRSYLEVAAELQREGRL